MLMTWKISSIFSTVTARIELPIIMGYCDCKILRMEKSLQMHVPLKLNILFHASTVLVSLAAIHES